MNSPMNGVTDTKSLHWMTKLLILGTIGAVSFGLGLFVSMRDAEAAPPAQKAAPRVIYPKNQKIDFEGLTLQGELKQPGEFYFQRKTDEKFDSLVKRRKNFHKEMLRDVVMSK